MSLRKTVTRTVAQSVNPLSVLNIQQKLGNQYTVKQVRNAVSQSKELVPVGKNGGLMLYAYKDKGSKPKRTAKPAPKPTPKPVSMLDSILEPLAALEAQKRLSLDALHAIKEIVDKAINEVSQI